MEQFSIEKYLANPSRKVVTRDGKNVRILCTNRKLNSKEVVGLIMNNDGTEDLFTWSKQGKSLSLNDSSFDLFFAPEKHEGWVNISREEYGYEGGLIYDSKEDAEKIAKVNKCCIATVKIEWEE